MMSYLKTKAIFGIMIVIIAIILVGLNGLSVGSSTRNYPFVYASSSLSLAGNEDGILNNRIYIPCNCVVFRMDDIQDWWQQNGQLTPMDLFISKNQSLSVGSIMNEIGNDSKIINKVREGQQKGLFELALHGWNHVDYTKISEQEQKDTLFKANEKMQKLFGHKSQIFIPPYDIFNNNTLKAMGQLGLKIVSADAKAGGEYNYGYNTSLLIDQTTASKGNKAVPPSQQIHNLPGTSFFKLYEYDKGIKVPIEKIEGDVTENVARFGYGVIVFHPQDFIQLDKNGKFIDNKIDKNEIKDLSTLIDFILGKGIHIVSFSKITKINPVIRVSTPANVECSTGWHTIRYFTPIETDYNGPTANVHVDGVFRNFYISFLEAVRAEGWGKTKLGDYIASNYGTYHSALHPLNSKDTPLQIGDIAIDPLIIPIGSKVKISTLPAPWNNKVYTAADTGSIIKGKIISIYVGSGKLAFKNTGNLVTSNNTTVCYQVWKP
jgi:3D (Asp-Asp-Asp) domain-containing protein/peptidoglycan/xylan/chitin deacetylase (PgdA/CDA1 family)